MKLATKTLWRRKCVALFRSTPVAGWRDSLALELIARDEVSAEENRERTHTHQACRAKTRRASSERNTARFLPRAASTLSDRTGELHSPSLPPLVQLSFVDVHYDKLVPYITVNR